jgi:hypothetical protein
MSPYFVIILESNRDTDGKTFTLGIAGLIICIVYS